MKIYLLHETYYTPQEDIISTSVRKAFVSEIKAEKIRQEWENSNDDERVEYWIQAMELVEVKEE